MSLKRDAGKAIGDGDSGGTVELQVTESSRIGNSPTDGREEFVDTLAKLDSERHALVQSTIEQLHAGAAVDKNTYGRIRTIDAQKHRLLVARFASLLQENGTPIKQLVEHLLQI